MKKKPVQPDSKPFTDDVAELGRDLWLAGLGAVVAAEEEGSKLYETLLDTGSKRLQELQEEATTLFEDLVKRGKAFERKSRTQLTAQVEAVKEEVESVKDDLAGRPQAFADRVERTMAESVEKTMERLEVPTRTEVRTLTEQVDRLAKQVRALTAELEK